MKDRTHDISLIDYHVKDVETFGKVLNNAAAAAFPRSNTCRYCDVCVLLLSWEDDDLGVALEIDDLETVFRDVYGYRVERWKIPSTTSHNSLVYRIMQVLRDFESSDKLLITYYAGHGFMNDDRQCVWLSNQQPGASTLQWSSIQTMLEEAECDVLVLLDCCAAASSGGNYGKGVTELIAACGFEAFAPGVGEHSFTRSLIEELKYLNKRCDAITTALLHNKVLARIKKSWNPRYSTNGSQERRRTPIHIHLSDHRQQRCIKLVPLRPSNASTTVFSSLQASSSPSSAPSISTSEDVGLIGSEGTSQSSLSEVWPDNGFESPKVLISVALQEDQRLNTEDWLEWLKAAPALAKFVSVEGVFKSDSTLVLLTLPIAVWDAIGKDPAITFLAFVRSHNLGNISGQRSHTSLMRSHGPYKSQVKPDMGYWPDHAQVNPNVPADSDPVPIFDALQRYPDRRSRSIRSYDSGYADDRDSYLSVDHDDAGWLRPYPSAYGHWQNDSQGLNPSIQPALPYVLNATIPYVPGSYGFDSDGSGLPGDISPLPHLPHLPRLPHQHAQHSPLETATDVTDKTNSILKLHSCDNLGCSARFRNPSELAHHRMIHNEESSTRKIDCPEGAKLGSFCQKTGENGFTRRDQLREHLRKVHHIDVPNYGLGPMKNPLLAPSISRRKSTGTEASHSTTTESNEKTPLPVPEGDSRQTIAFALAQVQRRLGSQRAL